MLAPKQQYHIGRALLFSLFIAATVAAQADPIFLPRQFSDIEQALGGPIPYPPEKFVRSLLALDTGSTVTSSIFPHDRSLERFLIDVQNPRTAMVWLSTAASAPYYMYFA